MEIGQTVTWTSQAMGCEKSKTGKVLAVIRAGQSARALIPATAKKSHIKGCKDISQFDRILVEVPTGKNERIKHYYTPKLSMIERCKV